MKKNLCLIVGFVFCWFSENAFGQITAEANLVLYLNFNNNAIIDASANEHAIINFNTSFTEGIGDAGLALNGNEAYLEIPHTTSLEVPNNLTTSVWYKHEAQEGNGFYPLIEQSAAQFGGHSRYGTWIFEGNKIQTCIEPDACDQGMTLCQRCVTAPNQLVEGQWYHIVSTYDGSRLRIYVDGELSIEEQFATNTGISVLPFSLTVGTDIYAPNQLFLKGKLDEVRIYNIALNEIEVEDLFEEELDVVSSILAMESLDFSVYPNPAKNYLHLDADFQIGEVTIRNIQGQLIDKQFLNAQNNLDIQSLKNGIYFLQAIVNDHFIQKTVVVN